MLDKIGEELEESRQEVIDDCIPSENAIVVFNEEPDRQDFMEEDNLEFIKRKMVYYFG